jgi:hypothetical protein
MNDIIEIQNLIFFGTNGSLVLRTENCDYELVIVEREYGPELKLIRKEKYTEKKQ